MQVPDTILAGKEGPSLTPRRRKPWEKESETQIHGDSNADTCNEGHGDEESGKGKRKEKETKAYGKQDVEMEVETEAVAGP